MLGETITKTPAQQWAPCLDLHVKCVSDGPGFCVFTLMPAIQLDWFPIGNRLRRQGVIGRVIDTQRRVRGSMFGAVPLSPRTPNRTGLQMTLSITASGGAGVGLATALVSSSSYHPSRRTYSNNLHALLLKKMLQALGSPGSWSSAPSKVTTSFLRTMGNRVRVQEALNNIPASTSPGTQKTLFP